MKNFVILLFLFCCCLVANVRTYGGSSDAVRLSEVKVLTLYHGKMTAGRRSSPVPQLKCVGGTAGCRAFTPKVVQCYNRGWDGNDIQWECKTDMDNAYRFGDISVSCEGFSYAEDPYILKGSCGLEYTLDLTKEGYGNQQRHDYYDSGSRANDRKGNYSAEEPKTSFLGNVILLAAVGLIIYALYRTCIAPPSERVFQSSTTSDDFGGYPGGDPYRANAPPPPAGFRSEFAPNAGSPFGASCGGGQTGFGSTTAGGRPGSGAGGFWTGAAAGGLLGYMFGNRGNARTSHTYRADRNDYSDNTFWGGTSRRGSGSSPSSGTSSTGTRTASGFGGTTRR